MGSFLFSMDRTAWIAVTCCLIGLVAWQYYFSKAYPPLPAHAPTPVVATASANPSPALTSGRPEDVTQRTEAAPAPATPSVPETRLQVTTPQLKLTFTNLGGGIAEAEPLGKEHLAEDGLNVELNHAGLIPIGALSAKAGEDATLPYEGTQEGNTVRYTRTEPSGLKITKEYTLDYQGDEKQIPAVRLAVTFANTGAQPYRDGGYYVYAGSSAPIHRRDQPQYLAYDWLADGKYRTASALGFEPGRVPLLGYETRQGRSVITEGIGKAAWVAVKDQFYTTVVAPIPATAGEEPPAREVWARRFDLTRTNDEIANNAPVLHGLDAALGMPALDLAPGATSAQTFQIYAGPKYYSRLEKLGHQEQEVMDFGKFKVVSILLLGLMNTFHGWFGSYAVAIILLTILVKSVLFPLQNKANKSMKRMSVLSPQLSAIREKYASDPTRMNTETMKVYRANGMSPLAPLGGCWPMLIQMPIFFGFLYMLGVATELRNSSFLWVRDLSQPDTVGRLFGFPINVLPLAMMGTQFWQMRLTPRTGDPAQQKTLMFMPLLFGFFCYSFAAALALYYTVQGLLTILQLYLTRQNAAPVAPAAGGTAAEPVKFVPVKDPDRPKGFGGFGSSANYGKKGPAKKR